MQIFKVHYYTTLDVRGASNSLELQKQKSGKLLSEPATYGLFESLVMPFGLTNCPR